MCFCEDESSGSRREFEHSEQTSTRVRDHVAQNRNQAQMGGRIGQRPREGWYPYGDLGWDGSAVWGRA